MEQLLEQIKNLSPEEREQLKAKLVEQSVHPFGGSTCPTGYTYDPETKKCVLNPGG